MPGWIGPWEIAIVAVVALIVFGPRRLPELGSSLGRAITGFKKGLQETEEEVRGAVSEASESSQDQQDQQDEQELQDEQAGQDKSGQDKQVEQEKS